jgi:hypothetical protein
MATTEAIRSRVTAFVGKLSSPFLDPVEVWHVDFTEKKRFIIGIAQGRNCGGGFAPEMNGVFVINEDKKNIVLDEVLRRPFGTPTPNQRELITKLKAMDWDAFRDWCNSQPTKRYDLEDRETPPPQGPAGAKLVAEMVGIVLRGPIHAYDAAAEKNKARFLYLAKRVCKGIIQKIDVDPDTCKISVNPSGMAGSGDVDLECPGLYVHFSQSSMGNSFMWRQGIQGPNRWMRWMDLKDFDKVCAFWKDQRESAILNGLPKGP